MDQNCLVLWTWIIAFGLALIITFLGKPIGEFIFPHRKNRFTIILLVFIMAMVATSSYDVLCKPPTANDFKLILLYFLHNQWIVFFVTVLIKLALIYGGWMFLTGLVSRRRLLKIVAKIFNVEISGELSPEGIEEAKASLEELKTQLTTISNLCKETGKYFISSFEKRLIDVTNPESIPQKFRSKIDSILNSVYANQDIKIYVISADENSMNDLPDRLPAIIDTAWTERSNLVDFNQNVGIIILTKISGLETMIVLDARSGKYQLAAADIYAVAELLFSLATTVSWAAEVMLV